MGPVYVKLLHGQPPQHPSLRVEPYLELISVKCGQLKPVEVLEQLLDLVLPVDVRDRVDPVPGRRRAGGDVRGDGEASEAAPTQGGARQGAPVHHPLCQGACSGNSCVKTIVRLSIHEFLAMDQIDLVMVRQNSYP